MVITSALGRGSAKKSPEAVVTRSSTPAFLMVRAAMGSTTGRSNVVQRRWGWCWARMIDSWPVAPPTSQTVW